MHTIMPVLFMAIKDHFGKLLLTCFHVMSVV